MKLSLQKIRQLVKEELGRNMQSPPAIDIMHTWQNLPGIDVKITANPGQGGWYVKIKTDDGEGDTPLRFFSDETGAKFWARDQVTQIQNKRMNTNPNL
jgi:hypothetical protein